MFYSTDPVHDAARYFDARHRYDEALEAEEVRLARETIAQANAGDYSRLIDAMGYRDNDKAVMRALVLCANKGNVEAVEVVNLLAQFWAEHNAEVD